MRPLLKKLGRPIEKLRGKRGPSREGSIAGTSSLEVDCTLDDQVKLSTPDPQKANVTTHLAPKETRIIPSITINEPPVEQELTNEQSCSPVPVLGQSIATKVQPEVVQAPITPPERIWNEAYDQLRKEERKLVQEYEKILSFKLNGETAASIDLTSERNDIEGKNVSMRRAQMHQLINDGLNKIRREVNMKENIGAAMQVVDATKQLVGDAVKDIPQAALPWAIVCVSLEILVNPISQTEVNHKGIEYCGTTTKWYWKEASLLFDEGQNDDAIIGAQHELQTVFIDFYKKLLQNQMKSICNYYRHRGLVFLKDLVKLDDWDGSLSSIRSDEAFLRERIRNLLSHKSVARLTAIDSHTKAQAKYQQTQEDQQCLRDLRITDPRADKSRIENTKGGLLQESYRWILENPQFQAWRKNDDNRLLWLRGDPGKGKTMLLCGLTEELMHQSTSNLVTYFFCQATVPTINNHTAVLRGLIWLLANQKPSLVKYIRESYDNAGKNLFDEGNAWCALSEIFSNMLRDKELPPVYIIIDALDECITGRIELLRLIQDVSICSNAKWAVSSRNWPEIEERLIEGMSLSLEVNATLVANAVDAYISHKASQISLLKKNDTLKEEVCRQMREKANGTFLWVAIVFKSLFSKRHYDNISEVLKILDNMPEGLTDLYAVMLGRISQLEEGDGEHCRNILATATLAHRPLHLGELPNLAGLWQHLTEKTELKNLIDDCGSFLTVREDYLYFIHQSAREYLIGSSSSQSVIFPSGMGKANDDMVSNSLDAMRRNPLQRNIYGLEYPGILIDDVNPPNPNPLAPILYSCTHWIAHLCEANTARDDTNLLYSPADEKGVLHFLKQHFLHWLEALALTNNLRSNIVHMKKFHQSLKQHPANKELRDFVYDVSRFMQYHAGIIQKAPMQIYFSALQFSPEKSLVRTQFAGQLPSWMKPTISREEYWSPRLQTIEVDDPREVTSRGTHLLILEEASTNVTIWDMVSGKRVHILHHAETVRQAEFSSNPKHALTVTWDQILLWDLDTGAVVHEVFEISTVGTMVSNDGKLFACFRGKGVFERKVEGEIHAVSPENPRLKKQDEREHPLRYLEQQHMRWSNNSNFLAVGLSGMDVSEVIEGKLRRKMKIFEYYRDKRGGLSFSFSHDSKLIAIVDSGVEAIDTWDLDKEEKTQTIYYGGSSWRVAAVEFSKDSTFIAAGLNFFKAHGTNHYYYDEDFRHSLVHIWDVATGQKKHELQWRQKERLHEGQQRKKSVRALAWSDDAKSLAVAFGKSGVEICDMSELSNWVFGTSLETPPYKVIFSQDFKFVTALTDEDSLSIWDTATGSEIFTVDIRTSDYARGRNILKLFEGAKLFYIFDPLWHRFSVWDIASNKSFSSHFRPTKRNQNVTFSFDGTYYASWSRPRGREARLWKLTTDERILHSTIHLEKQAISCLEFSNKANYIVSLSEDNDVAIWHVATNRKIWEANHSTQADISKKGRCKNCAAIYNEIDLIDELYPHPSIAVSNDGKTVLVTDHRHHEMWILSEEGSRVRLQICCRYLNPSFDIESPYVLTEHGRINLNNLLTQAEQFIGSEIAYDYQFLTEGYGIGIDRSWITWNGKNIIWLPESYRPIQEWAISRDCIAIGTEAPNRVNIFSFSGPPPFKHCHFRDMSFICGQNKTNGE